MGTRFSVSGGWASLTATTLQLWRPKCSYNAPHLTHVPFPGPGPSTGFSQPSSSLAFLLTPTPVFHPSYLATSSFPPSPPYFELASLSSPQQRPQCPMGILLCCFLTTPELPAHLTHMRGARTHLPPGQGRLTPSSRLSFPRGSATSACGLTQQPHPFSAWPGLRTCLPLLATWVMAALCARGSP